MSISQEALQASTHRWESLGSIADGGTVFGVALSPVPEVMRYWAATGCGIFFSDDQGDHWTQNLSGLTTPLLSTLVIAPNGALFAGALGGDIFTSFDWGKTWDAGKVPDEHRATITAMLASPNFRTDGTVFAATDGAGLLVTRNAGKSWEDSSFGLAPSNVLALAAAPDWSQRETMFAATSSGVFASPNGGRAWRETELMLEDDAVDTLVVSPAFERDHTVYAGTEQGSLYRSTNGGRSWERLAATIGEGPLNCLWLAPDFAESGKMVAGVGASIYGSADGGETWQLVANLPNTMLTLAGDATCLLAGLHDAGVWRSRDGGQTWAAASQGLTARGFARLLVVGTTVYALGPQEGLWASLDHGLTWHKLPGLDGYLPVTAAHVDVRGTLIVATQGQGLLRSTDGGQNWSVVLDGSGIQTLVLASDDTGWAGDSAGNLWVTRDGGLSWQDLVSPCVGQEIISLVISTTYAEDHTVFMGSAIPAESGIAPRVVLWRSTDSGATWKQVTSQATSARWMDISMPTGISTNAPEQAVMATGPFCLRPLRRAKDVWISTRVDPYGANTLAVVAVGEVDNGGLLFAATGTGIYRSIDGGRTWQSFLDGLGSTSFISLALWGEGAEVALYALSLGGALWKRQLP